MIRSNKQLLFVKNEPSYQTALSLNTIDLHEVHDFELIPFEAEIVERKPLRNYLGHSKPVVGKKYLRCKFSTELISSGRISNPKCHLLLLACGMAVDTSSLSYRLYKPASNPSTSICLQHHLDGIRTKITGARGSFNIAIEAGTIPKINFEFVGLHANPTTHIAPTVSAQNSETIGIVSNPVNTQTMLYSNRNITAHRLIFDLNNQITQSTSINHEEIYITDRKPKINLDCEFHQLNIFNPINDAISANNNSLIIQHGTSSGNIIKIIASKTAITQTQYYSENNIMMQSIEMFALPSSGNDELKIYFK